MSSDLSPLPVDGISAERLAANGLRMDLVDTTDATAFALWVQAEARGFHDPRLSDASIAELVGSTGDRRTTGIWDDTAADPATPVATVSSWPTELGVPGESSVPAWAISAVTVAPTHRRRGIARAMLESELRIAADQNIPVAVLTVSETTIYGRYGFSPAALAADLKIDPVRGKWSGPHAPGRVNFVSAAQLRAPGRDLIARTRPTMPGQIGITSFHWDRYLGLVGDTSDSAKKLRIVRYDNPAGELEGFAIYSLDYSSNGFFAFDLEVKYLVAATEDASAGLWRFVLEQDLLASVTAPLRSADDPVRWQLADFRALTTTTLRDHLWVRVLDVPVALQSRGYASAAELVLNISDPLGFGDGRFTVSIDDSGTAIVSPLAVTDEAPDAAAEVSLGIGELGALYLGGVSATTLARAGRIIEKTAGAARTLDRAFRGDVTPFCDFWF